MLARALSKRSLRRQKATPAAENATSDENLAKSLPRLSLHLPSPSLSPAHPNSTVNGRTDSDAKSSSLWVDVNSKSSAQSSPTTLRTSTYQEDRHATKRRLTAKIVEAKELLMILEPCCQEIISRGLETLGIFRPHRLAEHQSAQYSIIHRYLLAQDKHVLVSENATKPHLASDLFGRPKSHLESMQAEIADAGIHDVAAVLKWALRHWTPSMSAAGSTLDWSWYTTLRSLEKDHSYPRAFFSTHFVPSIQTAHQPILTLLLQLISSISIHSESNGMSATRLCKLLGYWLFSSHLSNKDAVAVYTEWWRSFVVLHHFFLAYLYEQDRTIPKRLRDLVKGYQGSTFSFDPDVAEGAGNTIRIQGVWDVAVVEAQNEMQIGQVVQSVLGSKHALRSANQEDQAIWNELQEAFRDGSLASVLSEDYARVAENNPGVSSDRKKTESNSPGRRRSFSLDSPTRSVQPAVVTTTVAHDDTRSPGTSELARRYSHTTARPGPAGLGRFPNRSHSALPSPTEEIAMPSWKDFVSSGFSFDKFGTNQELTLKPDYTSASLPAPPTRPETVKLKRNTASTPKVPSWGRTKSPAQDQLVGDASAMTVPLQMDTTLPLLRSLVLSTIKLDEAFLDFFLDSLTEVRMRALIWPVFEVAELRDGVVSDERQIRFLLIEEEKVVMQKESDVQAVTSSLVKPKDDRRKLFATFSRRSSRRISDLPLPASSKSVRETSGAIAEEPPSVPITKSIDIEPMVPSIDATARDLPVQELMAPFDTAVPEAETEVEATSEPSWHPIVAPQQPEIVIHEPMNNGVALLQSTSPAEMQNNLLSEAELRAPTEEETSDVRLVEGPESQVTKTELHSQLDSRPESENSALPDVLQKEGNHSQGDTRASQTNSSEVPLVEQVQLIPEDSQVPTSFSATEDSHTKTFEEEPTDIQLADLQTGHSNQESAAIEKEVKPELGLSDPESSVNYHEHPSTVAETPTNEVGPYHSPVQSLGPTSDEQNRNDFAIRDQTPSKYLVEPSNEMKNEASSDASPATLTEDVEQSRQLPSAFHEHFETPAVSTLAPAADAADSQDLQINDSRPAKCVDEANHRLSQNTVRPTRDLAENSQQATPENSVQQESETFPQTAPDQDVVDGQDQDDSASMSEGMHAQLPAPALDESESNQSSIAIEPTVSVNRSDEEEFSAQQTASERPFSPTGPSLVPIPVLSEEAERPKSRQNSLSLSKLSNRGKSSVSLAAEGKMPSPRKSPKLFTSAKRIVSSPFRKKKPTEVRPSLPHTDSMVPYSPVGMSPQEDVFGFVEPPQAAPDIEELPDSIQPIEQSSVPVTLSQISVGLSQISVAGVEQPVRIPNRDSDSETTPEMDRRLREEETSEVSSQQAMVSKPENYLKPASPKSLPSSGDTELSVEENQEEEQNGQESLVAVHTLQTRSPQGTDPFTAPASEVQHDLSDTQHGKEIYETNSEPIPSLPIETPLEKPLKEPEHNSCSDLPEPIAYQATLPHSRLASSGSDFLGESLDDSTLLTSPAFTAPLEMDDQASVRTFETSADTIHTGELGPQYADVRLTILGKAETLSIQPLPAGLRRHRNLGRR